MLCSKSFADGTCIFNQDETVVLTVQTTQKVIAEKGIKQVSQATSAEKGTHVTTCCVINASDSTLPLAMIFPQVHFKEYMLAGAPPGTLGLAIQSGWKNTELGRFMPSEVTDRVESTLAVEHLEQDTDGKLGQNSFPQVPVVVHWLCPLPKQQKSRMSSNEKRSGLYSLHLQPSGKMSPMLQLVLQQWPHICQLLPWRMHCQPVEQGSKQTPNSLLVSLYTDRINWPAKLTLAVPVQDSFGFTCLTSLAFPGAHSKNQQSLKIVLTCIAEGALKLDIN
ncbi:hypothetical protein J437_LFUL012089 [Ladona fulva]|uniref:Uncharacterized protein n=1 Tax=Ladona fulva TaxID=123851 RepID=A0A8K0NVZ6_LADFU|nr:hypothetical protein J437_LFUL012089 [Ladona fulva]